MGFRGWSLARREEGARRATQACVLPLQKRPSPQPSPARGRGGMKRGAGHKRRRDVEGRHGEAKRVERRSGWRGEAGGEAKRVERRSGWSGAWIRNIRHGLYSLLPRAGEGARRADEGAF